MKTFVTGGTGFVGSHLVEALLARNDQVTCLVRNTAKAERIFPPDRRPHVVEGDLDDLDAMARGCRDADVVFHVAGLTSGRNRSELHSVNGHATRTIATVAKKSAPGLRRFVYVSSLAAAGPTTKGTPLDEKAPAQPVSDYGWSKLAGEEAVRASGVPWTIVRPPTVYGPRDTEVLKVFKLAKRGVTLFFGDGTQELSLIYVRDLADALVGVLHPDAAGRVFFASHPEIWTSRRFAEEIYGVLHADTTRKPWAVGIPAPVARAALWTTGTVATLLRRATLLNADKANEFLAEAWTCSSHALTTTTGWRPATELNTGLRHTMEWYRTAQWL